MDLKKKMKAFFTLKRRANGGFTLVELIVVIAILAILAGVAIPAYSGYVAKAEAAADEQLLAAVNTAFVSACLANGENNTGRTDVTYLAVEANGTVNPRVSNSDKINASFAIYFAGNQDAAFKVNKSYKYNGLEGIFKKADSNLVTQTFTLSNGQQVTLTYEEGDLESFKASAYAEMSKDGSLLTNVDMVVEWAQDFDSTLLSGVEKDPNFMAFASEVLKKDYATMSSEEQMNALVLYTAQKTDGVNASELLNTMISGPGGMVSNGTGLDNATDIAGYAMQYALALAYYREKNPTVTNPSVDDVLDAMNDRGSTPDPNDPWGPNVPNDKTYFQEWLVENGQSNLDGYLGAMGLIADNTANVPADQLLANGYNNDDLKGMLNQLLGNSGS